MAMSNSRRPCPTASRSDIPGQFAGEMGESFDPWLIEASQYRDTNDTHGAFPEYGFQRQRGRTTPENYRYEAPRLELAQGGEFGRTPKVFTFPGAETKLPGRDHWGAVQTVFFAGGGVRGGTVVGESDAIGGYPKSDPQTPENMAATIVRGAWSAANPGLER